MLTICGRHYENGEPVRIRVEGERIAAVDPVWPPRNAAPWPYVAPGLFDLQINGHGGIWFGKSGITADEVLCVLKAHFRFGLTRLCPTLITNSFDALAGAFAAIREASEREPWADRLVPGCHLEGPYISEEDGPRGAHPREHVRPPDWAEFEQLQEISGRRVRLVTLAPELPGTLDFIRRAVGSGVVVAIGHTAANGEQIGAAVEAGARLSTHLGNGAHGMIRRHPNYIWEQLGDPRLSASVIADGHHLPTSVLRSILRTKSTRNVIITCDAAGLAGCAPGVYTEGTMRMEVLDDGRIVIAGQRQLLAGSAAQTGDCVVEAVRQAGVPLWEAIDMAGRNPARLLGFEEIRLRRGARADLFLFNFPVDGNSLDVVATVAAGTLQFGTIPSTPVARE
ncbi:MAG TPA: amidohydrolase family protein [Planctomycetaceae bacterium]|jgi:N-acetylglucosamine-6-phosphate deacetylase|nr:amidohydrolase family protein [Planctomycetaceae bacterium]